MNTLEILTAIAALTLLQGCDELSGQLEEQFHHGTVRGMEQCVANAKSEQDGGLELRRSCIDAHEKVYPQGSIGWKFNPVESGQDNRWAFHLLAPNKNNDLIFTRAIVRVHYYDDTGKQHVFSNELDNLWVEPGEGFDMILLFDSPPHDVPDCKYATPPGERFRNCRGWSPSDLFALKITE